MAEPGSVVPASDPRIDLSAAIFAQRAAVAAGTHMFYMHSFMTKDTARQLGCGDDART